MTDSAPSRIPALGPRGEGWVVLQLTLIVAVVAACWWGGGHWYLPWQSVVGFVGNVLLIGGLLVGVIGTLGLSSSLTILPRPKDDGALVTNGLYRFVRNPIYAGLIAATFGASIASGTWLALALSAVLAVVLDLKTRREEVFLRARFPDYAAYAARTRKFIPGLY
ncbi:MAG: isoprenylcysteine carboxylmethyltransferase family protein [Chloroflexota bacterium]